jgi:hypothetical protein
MNHNLAATVRAMPGYTIGLAHGTDIGLVIALTAITSERNRLAQLRTHAPSPNVAFADGALHRVASTLAARFRAGAAQ